MNIQNLKTSDFDYYLPEELIAQKPPVKRSGSRLLVLDRASHAIEHKTFNDIVGYLRPSDVLVLNNTRVIPARLYGIKQGGGARVEVLLLKKLKGKTWEVLARPSKRLKMGTVLKFGKNLSAVTVGDLPEGKRLLRFRYKGDFNGILARTGVIPLPPYIKWAHKIRVPKVVADRYQTVYASVKGATAAPTAGLHFTPELLDKIRKKGVEIEYVTLHTGLGTFQPVKAEYIKDHVIHSEEFRLDKRAMDRIKLAKKAGRRVIAVGTTVVRLLEHLADHPGTRGETGLFIIPGHKFKMVDAVITNFHLPRSTLLMLVSAFTGQDGVKKAYSEAVKKRYRFFSFGDAMLII